MHHDESTLRALLDGELPEDTAQRVRLHLQTCARCQERSQLLASRAARVDDRLRQSAPHAQTTDAKTAYQRLFSKIQSDSKSTGRFSPMHNRKPLWTALTALVVLAVLFSLTPVRAWASDFLGLFRVQKITVLEIDPLALENTEKDMVTNQDMLETLFRDNMTITGGGELLAVASAEEAAAQAGFVPRLPAALQDVQFAVQPGMNAQLTIDHTRMQALLDAMHAELQIAPELDGQLVIFDARAGIVAGAGCDPTAEADVSDRCVRLYQLPAPEVTAPEGLNVQELGEVMLRVFGLSEQEIRAFSSNIDWTSTLIIPIPRNQDIRYTEIAVDGVKGTLITGQELQKGSQRGYLLLWVKDGMLYALDGVGGAAQAQAIVETLP